MGKGACRQHWGLQVAGRGASAGFSWTPLPWSTEHIFLCLKKCAGGPGTPANCPESGARGAARRKELGEPLSSGGHPAQASETVLRRVGSVPHLGASSLGGPLHPAITTSVPPTHLRPELCQPLSAVNTPPTREGGWRPPSSPFLKPAAHPTSLLLPSSTSLPPSLRPPPFLFSSSSLLPPSTGLLTWVT